MKVWPAFVVYGVAITTAVMAVVYVVAILGMHQ